MGMHRKRKKKNKKTEKEKAYMTERLGTKKSQDDGDMFFFQILVILVQRNAIVQDVRGEYNNVKNKGEPKGDIYNEGRIRQ